MDQLLEEKVTLEDFRKKTIMLVDDSLGDLRIMVEALKELNFKKFILANNGGIAIAQARVSHPDVIVVDMHLPDMTGVLLGRALREIYGRSIPIICVTGFRKSPFLEKLNFEHDDSITFDRIIEKAGNYRSLQKIVESFF